MRVAIVHYWLVGMRGGEKVVEALCEMFPQADIFSHVYDASAVSEEINKHIVKTTFIQRLPAAKRHYQSYLPLMPLALDQLDLRDYDLVISSESGPAKGVIVGPDTRHICYCHSPMRYVWDMYHDYRGGAGWLKKLMMPPLVHYLRMWDRLSADRVDQFIANSHFVASRIEKFYRRKAEVIHPPVNVDDFEIKDKTDDYYLFLGQLVSYKRPDLAIKAFNQSGRKLVVIGEGEMADELREIAGNNIELLGRQPFSVIRDYLSRCRALIFPGVEDFGIVPVEAMASGRPVIAFRKGGSLETVVEGVTGLFFDEQTADGLNRALNRFEEDEQAFEPAVLRAHAATFGKERFKAKMMEFIERKNDVGEFDANSHALEKKAKATRQ